MRFTADRRKLLAAVSTVVSLAGNSSRGQFTATDARTTVSASRMDSGARCVVEGISVRDTGTVGVSLAALAQTLRGAAGESVELDARSGTGLARMILRTESGRVEFPLGEVPKLSPPAETSVTGRVAISLSGSEFGEALSRVTFAADRKARPGGWATTGVMVDISESGLALVATDTHCLAWALISSARMNASSQKKVLLPVQTVRRWARAVRSLEQFNLVLSDGGATIEAGPLLSWSAPLSGAFPQWDAMLAAPRPTTVTLAPAELLDAMQVTLVASDPSGYVDSRMRLVMLRMEPGRLTLSAGSDAGAARVEVATPDYAGPVLAVPLDGRQLRAYLAAVSAEAAVTFAWETAERPVVFSAGKSRFVAMPLVDRTPSRIERDEVSE
jgi:DNA polymerase III sliding clamp (beta) subunit (PCNA family)